MTAPTPREQAAEVAEAERRYRDRGEVPLAPGAVRNARIEAFIGGAKWALSDAPAAAAHDAEVARAARVLPSVEDVDYAALIDRYLPTILTGLMAQPTMTSGHWETLSEDELACRAAYHAAHSLVKEAAGHGVSMTPGDYDLPSILDMRRMLDRANAPSREQVERAAAEKALREAADDPALPGFVHNNQSGNARRFLVYTADRLAAGGDRG